MAVKGWAQMADMAELLLDRGANAKAQDTKGRTPFDFAEANEYLKGSGVYLATQRCAI